MGETPFYHHLESKVHDGSPVWVFGVVTAIRKSKHTIFFDLMHALGTIQIVAEFNKVEEWWDRLKAIRLRDRLKVKGLVGITERGTRSVFLDSPPLSAKAFLADTLFATDPDFRQVGASLLIARARKAVEDFLNLEGYRRIDPRYVSASWHTETGLIPLHINYPGFGMPVYMAPSPAQQLSVAIAATGDDRVYCSATSFTTSYRRPSDGVETAIVMAKTLGVDMDELIVHGIGMLDAVCKSMPGVNNRYNATSLPQIERQITDVVNHDNSDNNSVWISPMEQGLQSFRLVLDNGITPVEGSAERHGGGITVGSLVFHLERILPLTENVPFRRLRNLGPGRNNDAD